ncbi:MAG: signal recognition particle-docking protein FtsY [Bifidobacteriaceae bacterium]|jgi:signal recognition particle-docking protein FtsY|nr:signal recognition particle-docking protein FtsY [Bifidobacteriaceae bacterium]
MEQLFIGVALLLIVIGIAIWVWSSYRQGKLFRSPAGEGGRTRLSLKTVEQKDLFEYLVRADFGVEMSALIAEEPGDLETKLLQFVQVPEYPSRALSNQLKPSVYLFVGVNGVGKTSTIGKLARRLGAQNQKVILGACDTFRAAASDQLQTWAAEVGADIVTGTANSDPSAVAYQTVQKAISGNYDYVLLDTAGRLQNKQDLMDELSKIKRVVQKQIDLCETLLVLDATTGQNGLSQAKAFNQAVDLSGIVLTKFDSSAKGGMIFNVQRALKRPVKLLGTGEGIADLQIFDPEEFVQSLL